MVNNAAMQFFDRMFLAKDSMANLEAVLPATTLAWLFLGFFQSIVGYAGVFVAQYHGSGSRAMCVRSYRAGLCMAAAAGLAMLPIVPLGDMLLSLTPVSREVVALEKQYFDMVTLGGVFLFGQMAASSFFTGLGRTRPVFWVNLGGNLLNIALDPVLIFGLCGMPKMGMAGAAYATVFSQAMQFVVLAAMAEIEARRAAYGETLVHDAPGCRRLFFRILRFGLASGGYEIFNMLSFTIFVFITGKVGDVAFAASNACFSVNYLLFAPMMGFAVGAQTLVGQARGRGSDADAALAVRRTLILGVGTAALMAGTVLVLHNPILSCFAPEDSATRAEFMDSGFKLMMLMFTWLLFDAVDMILSGALKGAGDTRFVFWWMLVCSFVIWMPLVFVVLHIDGTMPALWSTMIVYVVVISVGSAIRWRRGKWKVHRLV
jgi:MATE family multidrug resistance protein